MRKRIDIGWADLLFSLRAAAWPGAKPCFDEWAGGAITCLSVRSGLDLFLTAAAFPPGTEVLVSAITIPDMVRVIESHGLVAVPVDLGADTLELNIDSLKLAITDKSRAVVVAHLFGAVPALDAVAEVANQFGLQIFEDCAQAFDGDAYKGHPRSDVVAFSFGPIKTATALGGGLLLVRDGQQLDRMRQEQARHPVQPTMEFAKRVLKYGWLKFVGSRWVFSALALMCRLRKADIDEVLSSSVRNFGTGDLLEKLRRQPCRALQAAMYRRVTQFNTDRQRLRTENGRLLCDLVGTRTQVAAANVHHSFWVSVVQSDDPPGLVAVLRSNGFDATTMSQLKVVLPCDRERRELPAVAELLLPRLVFLPHYPEMPQNEVRRMASLVAGFESQNAEMLPTPQRSEETNKVLNHV